MLSIYPAYFTKEETGYSVYFHDMPNLFTHGNTMEHALENAMDCLVDHLYTAGRTGETVPVPSKINELEKPADADTIINMVAVNVDEYAGKELNNWRWIENACGIKMPYNIARDIKAAIVQIANKPVTEIDISENAREKWLAEFKTTKNLGAVSTVSYLFYPDGVNSYTAALIMSIMDSHGVDLQKMLCNKLRIETQLSKHSDTNSD